MENMICTRLFFHVCHLALTGYTKPNARLRTCIYNPNIRWNNFFLKHQIMKGKPYNYLLQYNRHIN